jgi:hypothetical protein
MMPQFIHATYWHPEIKYTYHVLVRPDWKPTLTREQLCSLLLQPAGCALWLAMFSQAFKASFPQSNINLFNASLTAPQTWPKDDALTNTLPIVSLRAEKELDEFRPSLPLASLDPTFFTRAMIVLAYKLKE